MECVCCLPVQLFQNPIVGLLINLKSIVWGFEKAGCVINIKSFAASQTSPTLFRTNALDMFSSYSHIAAINRRGGSYLCHCFNHPRGYVISFLF